MELLIIFLLFIFSLFVYLFVYSFIYSFIHCSSIYLSINFIYVFAHLFISFFYLLSILFIIFLSQMSIFKFQVEKLPAFARLILPNLVEGFPLNASFLTGLPMAPLFMPFLQLFTSEVLMITWIFHNYPNLVLSNLFFTSIFNIRESYIKMLVYLKK